MNMAIEQLEIPRLEALPSFRGREWHRPDVDIETFKALRPLVSHPLLAQILAGRSITAEKLDAFLNPKISESLPDPFFFLDMEPGAKRIAQAIKDGQRIGIWSDYDVDGATSGATLEAFLQMCGHDDVVLRIPDRIADGYGPNTPGLLKMQGEEGCDLICILDAGTVAFEPLEAAAAAGIEVVVIDHHMAEDRLPPAVAVINPNRKDQAPGFGHLCAAGVTFVFAVAVARELKQANWFASRGGMPDFMELLDLVALGTVCDVVPLTGLNRAFVSVGAKYLSKRARPGVAALAEVAGIEPKTPIDAKACGWMLGPRINAGGRIGDSASGALLLMEKDPAQAALKAGHLEDLNRQRKELDGRATEDAMLQHPDRVAGRDKGLVLSVVDTHEGVVGISAGRCKEAFDAPAIVLTRAHDGTLKGSARSVPGFDIGHAIIEARQAGLLVKGGGHGMAGGLTIEEARVPEFIAFMDARIAESAFATTGVRSVADAKMTLDKVDLAMIDSLAALEPCGTANTAPVVIIEKLELAELRILKEKHYKMMLCYEGRQIDGLIWGVVGTEIGRMIEESVGTTVDVLGQLQINEFRGERKPQIVIDDIRRNSAVLI